MIGLIQFNNMYKIIVFYATPINNKPNQQQCLVDVANVIMATRPLKGKKAKIHVDFIKCYGNKSDPNVGSEHATFKTMLV